MLVTTGLQKINSTPKQVTEFILLGFPGFYRWQHWFSVPLAILLLLAVTGNVTIITTICREQRLHEPMCYFLWKLSAVDLTFSIVTAPKILGILWFDAHSISWTGCFTQMFFIHMLFALESGILVAMAFDRYIAICSPLRYTSILNNKLVVTLVVLIIARSIFLTLPVPLLAARLNYCSDYIVKYPFCNNLAVTKLACEDITLNGRYQIVMANSLLGTDLMLILLSYCLILSAVLKLNTEGAIIKTLGTCSSHLIIVFILYSVIIVLAITHSSKNELMTYMAAVLNVFLLNVPAALNPIVYGVRNKSINHGIRKQFSSICGA